MLSSNAKRRLSYVAGTLAFVSFLTGLVPVLSTSVLGIAAVKELSDASIAFTVLAVILAIKAAALSSESQEAGTFAGILAVISAAGLVACFFAGTYIHTANPAFLAQTVTSQLAIATGAAPGPLTFGEVFAGDVVIATGAAILIALFATLYHNLDKSADAAERI